MARTPLRSLSSAVIAVCATGVLSISIPLALMSGYGLSRPLAGPQAVLIDTATRGCAGQAAVGCPYGLNLRRSVEVAVP